ncbi:MAG: hypothetical protein AAGC46_02550 [Solirubrobacteraceae bacterium]|nr:hypothetical protein [Patulibacter sp.]
MPHDLPDPSGDPPVAPATDDAPVTSPTAPPADMPQRRGSVRALAVWLLALFITVALAVVAAWAGALLAVFGLSAVSLAVAVLAAVVAATVWRRAALPIAVVVCALTLTTASQALSTTRYARQIGSFVAAPKTPSDVPQLYRHGVGPMLIDLRHFKAADGSSTAIAATNDDGLLVVALPRDRCFDLEVEANATIVSQGGLADQALRLAGVSSADTGLSFSDVGLTQAATRRSETVAVDGSHDAAPWQPLLAYGRQQSTITRPWTRASGRPDAPTLKLNLQGSQQIVIRDYPDWVGPLDADASYDQQTGMLWPAGVTPPPSPGQLRWADGAWVRTAANRARWVAWERRMVIWAAAQARRYAGACASRAELRDRGYVFETQPQALRDDDGKVHTLLGGPTTRRSSIAQKPVHGGTNARLSVEVNGLGEARAMQGSDTDVDPADVTNAGGTS